MKFSEWTKRADAKILDTAAGDTYEQLSETAKACIDDAVERFINFCKSHVSEQVCPYCGENSVQEEMLGFMCRSCLKTW